MNYKDFDINTQTTERPWGKREEEAWKAIIDTVVVDTVDSIKYTLGHRHYRLFDSVGNDVLTVENNGVVSIYFDNNPGVTYDTLRLGRSEATAYGYIRWTDGGIGDTVLIGSKAGTDFVNIDCTNKRLGLNAPPDEPFCLENLDNSTTLKLMEVVNAVGFTSVIATVKVKYDHGGGESEGYINIYTAPP